MSISSGSNTLNWTLRRDWAALSGGATVVDFNGVDYSAFGCGPGAIFDQSQGSGWSTDAVLINPADQADVDPRFVIVQLPVAVDIADIQINPSGTCGDGLSASTGKYSVETSPDGTTWTLASTPGAAFGGAERNRMNSIALNAGTTTGIQFLRYTMLGTQLHVSGGSCPRGVQRLRFRRHRRVRGLRNTKLTQWPTPSPLSNGGDQPEQERNRLRSRSRMETGSATPRC